MHVFGMNTLSFWWVWFYMQKIYVLVWSKNFCLFWKIVTKEKKVLYTCVHAYALSSISPYGHTHKLCNLELPTIYPLALSMNEFWGYLLSCMLVWWRWVWCLWLIPFMLIHLQAHLNFVNPSLLTTLSNCHKQLIETCNSKIVVCCFKFWWDLTIMSSISFHLFNHIALH
jgi:hypothetical protein